MFQFLSVHYYISYICIVNKIEIDKFFTLKIDFINEVVDRNITKQVTINKESILSIVYEEVLINRHRLNNNSELKGFVISLIVNTLKWSNSKLNIQNKVVHNQNEFDNIHCKTEDFDYLQEIDCQNKNFAIEKFKLNAKPSEKRLYKMYFLEGYTLRQLSSKLNTSYYASRLMVNELKTKIRNYER